jgi:DNA-cytosine methyltransferase
MRVLDLFSGIGGFSLGLESVGMDTVAFCEMDKFCQKVLKKHWPNVPIHSDIKELDGYEYRGAVELICGGFPCQPFSVAGERRGSLDDRHLWPEMYRVIQEVQPTWILAENVSGLLNLELKNVLSDLEAESYAAQTFVLPACSVDAKHRRDRVWIIAYANRQGESDESTRTQERERFLADSGCQPKRSSSDRFSGESAQPGERAYSPKSGKHTSVSLNRAVKMWPTPTATEHKGARKKEAMEKTGRNPLTNSLRDSVEAQSGYQSPEGKLAGSLSPDWVEWLMGYPIGWTNLSDSTEQHTESQTEQTDSKD